MHGDAYTLTLIILHILGAIIGFGPTFTFGLLGPLAGKKRGPEGIALMEGMIQIERKLVVPIALTVQPITGVLLIFDRGWNKGFFGATWLWISLLLYIGNVVISTTVASPALHKLYDLSKAGPPSPETAAEMQGLAKRNRVAGTYMGMAFIVIAVLMIWKPGGPFPGA